MKKLIFSATLLTGIVVTAQNTDGKVGINTTEPQATLEIKPNAANANATTNEGLLIPRLTKERVAKMTAPTESTLVYVTDEVLTTDNAKFTGTGKGFYYYDAAAQRWIKQSGQAGQLWQKQTDKSIKLIDNDLQNEVMYTVDGYKRINKTLSSYQEHLQSKNTTQEVPISENASRNIVFNNTKGLKSVIGEDGNNSFSVSSNITQVDELTNNSGTNSNIVTNNFSTIIPNTYPTGVRLVRSGNFLAAKLDNNKTNELTGLHSISFDAGGGDITNALTSITSSLRVQKSAGTIKDAYSTLSRSDIYAGNNGLISNLHGNRIHHKVVAGNITNLYGASVNYEIPDAYTGTITNSYDFKSEPINDLKVTNQYGLYIQGSKKINYLQGKLGINTNKPTEDVDIVGENTRIGGVGRYNYIGIGSNTGPFGMYLGHNIKRNKNSANTFTSVASNSLAGKG